MITEKHLQKIKLKKPPWGQVLVANTLLWLDYRLPRRTNIIIQNPERIPRDRGVIFALNHTDSYNYWPFMYQLYRDYGDIFISPWVKGKYYENFFLAKFFDYTNNIPLPSRGYVLTKDFQRGMKRKPSNAEYRLLRDWLDGKLSPEAFLRQAKPELKAFVSTARGDFNPATETYAQFIEAKYARLMQRVSTISQKALLEQNINLLIFPQGTRSVRLLPGHIGLAQIALKTGAPVIPVGCNGSEKCYRGALPFSAGGDIVYRVGQPLTLEGDLAPFAISEAFEPFTRTAETAFHSQFRGATDLIMERVNALLDPPYQFADNPESEVRQGVNRFV